MSCYFRHLEDLFKEAGLTIDIENKKQIDRTIHEFLGITYKDCPSTWRALKPVLADAKRRHELIKKLHDGIR